MGSPPISIAAIVKIRKNEQLEMRETIYLEKPLKNTTQMYNKENTKIDAALIINIISR